MEEEELKEEETDWQDLSLAQSFKTENDVKGIRI